MIIVFIALLKYKYSFVSRTRRRFALTCRVARVGILPLSTTTTQDRSPYVLVGGKIRSSRTPSRTPSRTLPGAFPERSTLLDKLFTNTQTPVDAKKVGDSWLQILENEVDDTRVYDQAERKFHPTKTQYVYHSFISMVYGTPRLLRFDLGRTLSTSWDWRIEPAFSAAFGKAFHHLRNAVCLATWGITGDYMAVSVLDTLL